MRLVVVGTGYVGLVAGTCFAEMGHTVLCLDIDEKKVAMLQSGKVPLYEPLLEEMVRRHQKDGRLFFTTDYREALAHGVVLFIAVETPASEGGADLSALESVIHAVGRCMYRELFLVNKSTAPPGTVYRLRHLLKDVLRMRGVDIPFDIASNPEFLKESLQQ